MVTGKIYYSREDRIRDLHGDEDRVSWDNPTSDYEKINGCIDVLDEYIEELGGAAEDYASEVISADADEDAPARMAYARRELIESWALAQAALSKFAYVLRFDGNQAYERMINALKGGGAVDMRGL